MTLTLTYEHGAIVERRVNPVCVASLMLDRLKELELEAQALIHFADAVDKEMDAFGSPAILITQTGFQSINKGLSTKRAHDAYVELKDKGHHMRAIATHIRESIPMFKSLADDIQDGKIELGKTSEETAVNISQAGRRPNIPELATFVHECIDNALRQGQDLTLEHRDSCPVLFDKTKQPKPAA